VSLELERSAAERRLRIRMAEHEKAAKDIALVLDARRPRIARNEIARVIQVWRNRTGGQTRYGELADMIVETLDTGFVPS